MAACMKKNIENKPCAVFSSLPLVLSILAMVQPFHVFAKSEPIKIPELPASPGGPLEIRVGIQILNIYSIDSRTESFDADLYFWASWQDPKALEVFEKTAGSELVVSRETAWGGDQKLWNPYLELNTSSLASQDREVLTLYPSGKVEYGTRIVGQFKPPEGTMNFRMFPFDQHQLRIEASSFVYKSREVNFRADKELLKPDGPESIFEKVHMQEWKIRGAKILTQTEAFTGTDSDEAYSVIGFDPPTCLAGLVYPSEPLGCSSLHGVRGLSFSCSPQFCHSVRSTSLRIPNSIRPWSGDRLHLGLINCHYHCRGSPDSRRSRAKALSPGPYQPSDPDFHSQCSRRNSVFEANRGSYHHLD
jgi:hypothetical protein